MPGPDDDYQAALKASKRVHDHRKAFSGRFMLRYAQDIAGVAREHGCITMLDYGCGRGVQYEPFTVFPDGRNVTEVIGIMRENITLYDPATAEYSAEPVGQFDLVICTQVLGTIPLASIPWVVDRLHGFARKAIYVGERIGPIGKKRIHAFMEEKMPRGLSFEQWAELLKRPASGVSVYFRTMSGVDGTPGHAMEKLQ